jgi:glutamate-1-semialdehyde aminotransferase
VIEPAATQWTDDPHHLRDRAYLQAAEGLARRHGALLVLDEIYTGFRFRGRSAQAHFGVRPDLTCLAKALSNGMALSALVGRDGVLRRQLGRIVYAPTNKGEAHAFAAARAALGIYLDEDVPGEVWAAGEALRTGVDALCLARALPARLVGPPYRMLFRMTAGDREQRRLAHTALQQELAREGVVSHRGYAILSRRHDDQAIARCLAAYARALDRVAEAVHDRSFAFLDIPDVEEELQP